MPSHGTREGEANALILFHPLVPGAPTGAWRVMDLVHEFDTLCLTPDTPAVLGCITIPPRVTKRSPRSREEPFVVVKPQDLDDFQQLRCVFHTFWLTVAALPSRYPRA